MLSLNQRWTPSALLIEDTASCQTLIQSCARRQLVPVVATN